MGDVVRCLGSGADFGCRLTYKVQEEAGGIAQALALTEDFAGDDRICVVLGDNIFQKSIRPYAEAFRAQVGGARVVLKQVTDPRSYGVAALDEKHVIQIDEKPEEPRSNYAVVGLYFYGPEVYEHIRHIEPSRRGELEITAVNNRYIAEGGLMFDICEGEWTDAGTMSSYQEANRLLHACDNAILDWTR